MTRSSTNELFTPLKDPEREFYSSRKLFKTLNLDESRASRFDLFSDLEENSKEEVTKTMAKTMEEYMSKTRADYRSGVTRPKIDDKYYFKLKGQFLKELRDNTFSGSDHEDANEHIEKVLEIVGLFHIINLTQDQIMLLRDINDGENHGRIHDQNPKDYGSGITRPKINDKDHFELKGQFSCNYETTPSAVQIMKVILFYNGLEVPTRQILNSKRAIPTKTTADAKVAIQEMAEYSQKWHNETSRTRSTETSDGLAAIQAQLSNLGREIKKVNEKVYVAQERGFGSLPSSTETNPKDHVKLISTTIEADMTPIRCIRSSQYVVSAQQNNNSLPRKEKDLGSFTLPCYINNVYFVNALADLGASCMTRSLTKELFTPFKDPKRLFHSSRKLFKTLSCDESRSLVFDLFSDLEENCEEKIAETTAKTMEEYMIKTRKTMDQVILFYNGLEVPTRQILNSKRAIPTKTAADAKVAIQEMAEYSQKWHNETSRTRSTETSDGLAVIQAQLSNLGKEIKKVNEKVYVAQVGCEQCKGPHYTKDCPLKEEAALGFYQRNNVNPSYQERIQSMEESLSASIKTLEIQIGQMSKVLQERGFRSLPSSTKTNLKDHVKSISTTIEADMTPIRCIRSSQYVVSAQQNNNLLPRKEKDLGSFTLPCYINNVYFVNALADLGASVIFMHVSTYLNLGLDKLAHTKLIVELADTTMKHPKGIAKNVLVGIDKIMYKGNNVVGALMNVPIFVGTFSVVTDFAVLENMDDYRDE
nr:hypothetical protein [Tanacetum cinerariifolium]